MMLWCGISAGAMLANDGDRKAGAFAGAVKARTFNLNPEPCLSAGAVFA